MSDRRGFLKNLVGAAVAAPAAAHLAEESMFDAFAGGGLDTLRAGRIVDGVLREAMDPAWVKQSADALGAIAKLGGSNKAPPELTMELTPDDRAKLVRIDRRIRQLSRLKSVSEAARDAYTSDVAA